MKRENKKATNNIEDFIRQMNELQTKESNVDLSNNWHLHIKDGLLRFAYYRGLPMAVQLKCIEIYVATLCGDTCLIGSYEK